MVILFIAVPLCLKGISRSGLKLGLLDDRSGLVGQIWRILDEDEQLHLI